MKISILGCGWFGLELAKNLQGHERLGTTTTPEKLSLIQSIGVTPFLFKSTNTLPNEIKDSDLIILNMPGHPEQLNEFKSWNLKRSTWIIFISSTSFYNSDKSILKDEEAFIQESFSEWTILRFGGLIGKDRHPGKSLSGRHDLKGKNWPVNLIHLDDTVGFTIAVIEKKIKNRIIDVVSDEHETKEKFYTEYAQRKNLPLPLFDQNDSSVGKIVSNTELKKIYELRWSRMIGKET